MTSQSDYMYLKTLYELQELRKEMKKKNPDGDKIFKLLCGDKYTEPLYERNSDKKRD